MTSLSSASSREKSADWSTHDGSYRAGGVRRLWRWLKPHRLRLSSALAFAALSAMASVLAPVVVGRVIIDRILLTGGHSNAPDFGQYALTQWIASAFGLHQLAAACLLDASLILVAALASLLFRIQIAKASLLALGELRAALFGHVARLPPAFFDRARTGQILTRVTNDTESLSELFTGLALLIGEAIPFAVAASVMLSLDPVLTLELTPFIPLAAFANHSFRRATTTIYANIRTGLASLNEYLHENISGIEIVQSSNREALNLERYSGLVGQTRHWEMTAIGIETAYFPFVENLSYLAMAAMLWFGSAHIREGALTLGSLTLFIQFSDMLFRPVIVFGDQASNLFRARTACERIFRLFDWSEDLHDPASPAGLPARLRGKIEFRDLSFRYGNGKRVLDRVCLIIKPGETVAIVGPTGAGKTTLLRLIARMYDAPIGALFVDDLDVMDVSYRELRRRIGVVFQDFHVFPGTIYENIALGDQQISRERAYEAAQAVDLAPFIDALPGGVDSPVGDRGRLLSHGQRQLLSLARILVRDPQILILDEPTASVDLQTEQAVQAALEKVKAGRTSITIAHRLETIRNADNILVMDKGRIVECGRHDELLARAGLYSELHAAQYSGLRIEPS